MPGLTRLFAALGIAVALTASPVALPASALSHAAPTHPASALSHAAPTHPASALSHAAPTHPASAHPASAHASASAPAGLTTASDPVYPLRISADGRHLVDATGAPVVLNGDTPWSLAVQLTRSQVDTYLSDRAALGVNAIMFNLIEHKFGDVNPEPWVNRNGDAPFTETLPDGSLDFTTPNPAYWAEVDWIVEQAEANGILCLFVPAYLGWNHSDQGWASDVAANGVSRMRTYGEFLGTRYKDQDNVLWVMGGDWGPVSGSYDLTDEVNALVEGIKAAGDTHLVTAHDGLESAVAGYDQPWLDVNNTYAYGGDVPQAAKTDWQRPNAKPFFYIEGKYENSSGFSPQDVRAQFYQGILGGGFGHLYGAHNVWYFDAPNGEGFASTPSDSWQDALGYPAAQDLQGLSALLRVRDVTTYAPDYDARLLAGGGGAVGDASYAPCRTREDARVAVCYVPSSRTVTVDLDRLSGTSVRVAWFDPSSGEAVVDRTVAPSGTVHVTTPGPDDWVLLVDDEALGLPLPDEALPVAFASLRAYIEASAASASGRSVVLEWTTLTEVNSAGFEVQRQVDGGAFEAVAFVASRGGADRATDYRFVDPGVPASAQTLAYRLRQVDVDGAARFSPTVDVARASPNAIRVDAPFPEPATRSVTLRYALPSEQPVRVALYDVTGRRLRTLVDAVQGAGTYGMPVNVSDLGAGVYFLRVEAGPTSTTRRVTVVR